MPPAITISASPVLIAWAPSIIDFMPEAHTLLIVVQGTLFGIPEFRATCLAGA